MQLEIAVKAEASYSELLNIITRLVNAGTPLSEVMLTLRSLYQYINDNYDDELGDLIQDIEYGKHFKDV